MPIEIRKGMPDPKLDRAEFERRFLARFEDPAFDPMRPELRRAAGIAWAPTTRGGRRRSRVRPGLGMRIHRTTFRWTGWKPARRSTPRRPKTSTRTAPTACFSLMLRRVRNPPAPARCRRPWRLLQAAADALQALGVQSEVLDLARLTSGYDLTIFSCKACFSTSPALCHWPCSCYPNHSLALVNDAMHSIYPIGCAPTA